MTKRLLLFSFSLVISFACWFYGAVSLVWFASPKVHLKIEETYWGAPVSAYYLLVNDSTYILITGIAVASFGMFIAYVALSSFLPIRRFIEEDERVASLEM